HQFINNILLFPGTTQLKQFSVCHHGVELLTRSVRFVQETSPSEQQMKCWLSKVWAVVEHLDLQSVMNLTLIPTSNKVNAPTLITLSTAIIVQNDYSPISQAAKEALLLLKVQVISKPPDYVRHHQLHNYLNSSDARGVTQALLKVLEVYETCLLACDFNMWRKDEDVQALLSVIEMHHLPSQIKNLLKKITIFKANGRNNIVVDVSIDNCDKISPEVNDFPVNYPERLIIPSSWTERQLAKNLGATQLSKENLCLLTLQNTYSDSDISHLVLYILEDRVLQNSSIIQQQLRYVQFVPDKTGRLFLPSQLYDPEDIDNEALIAENLHPKTCFQKYYQLLRVLGMKKVQNMPRDEFIQIIKSLHGKSLPESEKAKKAVSLLRAMNRRSDCLQICQAVKSTNFVFGEVSKPVVYPDSLIWATSFKLYKPEKVKSYNHFKNVLGSVVPLVQCSDIQCVANNFGWNQKPDIDKIIKHLQNIMMAYENSDLCCFEQVKETYKQLSTFSDTSHAYHLNLLSALPCIFTEHGFRAPNQVYISCGIEDLQLLPYMYPLPFELRECVDLFRTIGCFENQSKELYLTLLQQIHDHHHSKGIVDVDRDRNIVVQVLHKLEKFCGDIPPSRMLLPVETNDNTLELVEMQHCSYSEQSCDWIDSEELGVRVVHSSVGTKLAKALGVEPLNKHLLAGQEAFMEWGQSEPLTTRLHNLLRQYRDGVAVLKELVQNADDAGATTVCFLYDERQNEDARTRLVSNKFQECQGPALWAYNNAKFTEDDLSNLKKLGGGTKEHLSTKIGKFGLGFCSVYNLTDTPSLVSGSNYVIFDPHQTYLEDGNNQKHGLRFDFSGEKNSLMLQKLHGQFKPFNEVFGCNIKQTRNFNGTLFRFPLRTLAQAGSSEISSVSYQHKEMKELLQMFSKIIGELLLFTQNIKDIEVYHLGKTLSPAKKILLYRSSRTTRTLSAVPAKSVCSITTNKTQMKSVSLLFNNNFKWSGHSFEENTFSEIKVEYSHEGSQLCSIDQGMWTINWLTSWHCGKGPLCKFSERLGGKALPLGAVAVPVKKETDGWQPIKLSELPQGFYKKSHMHCFLPLPVKTTLPVQLNGFFEVTSDRTSLETQTEDDRLTTQDWNKILMTDAINAAYHNLILTLQLEGLSWNCPYYTLWPVKHDTNDYLISNLRSYFYSTIVTEDVKVFRSRNGWHPLKVCKFFEESFYKVTDIGKIAFEYMEELMRLWGNLTMIELPEHVLSGFQDNSVFSHCITQNDFLGNYFIPNIAGEYVTPPKRDKLTLHIINNNNNHHDCLAKLKRIPCIPTIPNGTLKIPKDLIDPKDRIALLFSVSDERFPEDLFFNTPHVRSVLCQLGMMNTCTGIPVEMVHNRAETVEALPCHNCAVERSIKIFHYIETRHDEEQNEIAHRIQSVPFLPVMPKPQDWPVTWKGDMIQNKTSLICDKHAQKIFQNRLKSVLFNKPVSLCLPKFKVLVGSSHLLLVDRDDHLSNEILKKLGVIVHENMLPLQEVCYQIKTFIAESPVVHNINTMCVEIYDYFERKIPFLKSGNELIDLQNEKILKTKCGFMEPKYFADSDSSDCAPDLFSVRAEGLESYPNLMKALGIKSVFHRDSVLQVVLQKKEIYKSRQLSKPEVLQMSKLLKLLFDITEKDNGEYKLPLQDLHLPDTGGFLHPIDKLCTEDGIDLSSGNHLCLHRDVYLSQAMTDWLGIKSKTMKRLENCSNRLHFGQKEPLTTRLTNILKDYPCDTGIMKELLQNADDAGATEVAFIKDFRHLPDKKLFDKKWAPLQEPALCVYNNKGFTEKDLQGIQDLGKSCRIEDPASTGQYGIGFNAVYHLTDAPSFLTKGPDVPQGETLCMFDPHCKYDSFATPDKPGVQFKNLHNLRMDYPDSFMGYLEDRFLQNEGTVFRLPLRTSKESEISKKIMPKWQLDIKLKEFEAEMAKCLLFLRNVRKISIMTITEKGECIPGYSVQSIIQEENELVKLKSEMKGNKCSNEMFILPNTFDMVRASYNMFIEDTSGVQYWWYIVQQLGTENPDSVPEIVIDAFTDRYLNLLPHAGAAVLLETNKKLSDDMFTTSCYLPLPVESGLPFSVNGHFTLGSSRRDLWIGLKDIKAEWNRWLIKEVLAPAAVHAVDHYRKFIFPDNIRNMLQNKFGEKIKKYENTVPVGNKAKAPQWKNFVKWFYEYIINQQLEMFDVFTAKGDHPSHDVQASYDISHQHEQQRKGELQWHAFNKAGNNFPIYFIADHIDDSLLNTLKRLGMKICRKFWREILREIEIPYDKLTPESVLKFLLSWNKNYPDRCYLTIEENITKSPFLTTKNVCKVFDHLSHLKEMYNELDGLPLLLTNDMVLRCFDSSEPVFMSKYCNLLPELGNEFLNLQMVKHTEIFFKNISENFENQNVLKEFTLNDLCERLHTVLDESYHNCTDLKPLEDAKTFDIENWLTSLWSFVTEYIKGKFTNSESRTGRSQVNWKASREHILITLGEWALYPLNKCDKKYLIAVQNAWRIIDLRKDPAMETSVFSKLPVPHPYWKRLIPVELKLTATLKDPSAMLEAIYFHRKIIAEFGNWIFRQKFPERFTKILEYFGRHCKGNSLSIVKLRSLSIFEDVSGTICNLEDKKLIMPVQTKLGLDGLAKLACEHNTIILKEATSSHITDIYRYIDSGCIMNDLVIYAKFILPNFKSLPQQQQTKFLESLRDELSQLQYKEEYGWSKEQIDVVCELKRTPFIMFFGNLKTADNFYDSHNSVFKVLELSNLPQEWTKTIWQYFLKLAGMILKLTDDMYIRYASELSSNDPKVKPKSKVLTEYFFEHYKTLKNTVSVIENIEFLVPAIDEKLERILPHFKTRSGLVSFVDSVPSKLANILWTTRSLLPHYATPQKNQIKVALNMLDPPPEEKVVEHIFKLCKFFVKDNTNEDVIDVMESIYQYLQHCNASVYDRIVENSIPVVHIPNYSVFVSANFVVENLQYEIIPYLFKAPIIYGKYFDMFEKIGTLKNDTCDTYAQVLKMIHEKSQNEKLHPEESKSMKLAFAGLVEKVFMLDKLTVSELYLPTGEETLALSSNMYVVDNEEYLKATEGKLNEPTFAGIEFLKLQIFGKDTDFIKKLPENLQPKLLSSIIQEDLDTNKMEEISSTKFVQLKAVLDCQTLKSAIFRIVNHFNPPGTCLNEEEKRRLTSSLDMMDVKQLKEINTIMVHNGNEVGQRKRHHFIKNVCTGETKQTTLYISENIERNLLIYSLSNTLRKVLKLNSESVSCLTILLQSCDKPHEMGALLNEMDITMYEGQSNEHISFQTEVGTYLKDCFLCLLDNEFYNFHEGEIVCMKKYILGGVEDCEEDIFIIVEVKRLVKSHDNLFLDEYEVNTGCEVQCLLIVKAHQLYKFVRKNLNEIMLSDEVADTSDDNLTEQEIRKIRKQMKEIWKVEDEKERHHLLRRLILKWHPDKNLHRTELSTRVMQYIQQLLRRLERGETISDDEDDPSDSAQTSRAVPSDFYDNLFRAPPRQYASSHTFSGYSRQETKVPDYPEAQKWRKQAEHDVGEARRRTGGSACWMMYMCHQAAEKMLKAALYLVDRDQATKFQRGEAGHSLISISEHLTSNEAKFVAREMDSRVGHHTQLRYPSAQGCPCDRYTDDDSTYMLSKAEELIELLRPSFVR
ncbi:Sacsin-like 1, partial [Homarus americanus]